MKKRINWKTFIPLVFILGSFVTSHAQITQVEFIKTDVGAEDYLTIEKEWRAIHQRRLDQGLIYGWYLVKKEFTGSQDPYDYLTITVFPSFESMQTPTPASVYAGYEDDFFAKTESSRDVIRTEIYDTPIITEIVKLPQFIHVTFVKVAQGKDDEYLALEKDVWKPANELLIKNGIQSTYSVYRQLYPGGYANDYNYVTISGFADLRKVSQEPPEGWENLLINIGKDPLEVLNNTAALRQQVKMELWKLLETVLPR
jgi:hypothetical protein